MGPMLAPWTLLSEKVFPAAPLIAQIHLLGDQRYHYHRACCMSYTRSQPGYSFITKRSWLYVMVGIIYRPASFMYMPVLIKWERGAQCARFFPYPRGNRRQLSSKTNLSKHLRLHTGEKSFGYIACGKSVHRKAEFGRHLRLYGSVYHKRCSFDVTSHLRGHTGKIFGCTVCCTTFTIWKFSSTISSSQEDAMASQITSFKIVYSVHSGAYQRKHQSPASLAFVRGIHRWPVNSPHKWPVTRKTFPFDDVIMDCPGSLVSEQNVLYRSQPNFPKHRFGGAVRYRNIVDISSSVWKILRPGAN